MKKLDYLFVLVFLGIIAILIIPVTRNGMEDLTDRFPYLMGFVKTAILASYGEMLAARILKGSYFARKGVYLRLIIWGFLGMSFVLMFNVFHDGVNAAIDARLLPYVTSDFFWGKLYRAFMTSLIMNLIFAPTFMIFHRITDTFIDLGDGCLRKACRVKMSSVLETIEWKPFFGFVVLKTIPLFWVPAHTITFMLPQNYYVLMAGFLSIALGLILTFAKMRNVKKTGA